MYSNPLTWQDRMIVKIGHALVAGHASKTTKVFQIFKLHSLEHIFIIFIYFLYMFIFLSLNHTYWNISLFSLYIYKSLYLDKYKIVISVRLSVCLFVCHNLGTLGPICL